MLDDPIARRYFVMNFFDGIMTAFGLVVGGAAAIGEPLAIIKAGLGTSLAIMVSGFFGAYMAEKSERDYEIKELEKHTFGSLKGSVLEKEAQEKSIKLALVDAISPFFGALIPILPFIFTHFGLIPFNTAVITSLAVTFLLLLILGWYLGRLLNTNPWKNALIFGVGGLLVGLVFTIFEHFLTG